MDSSTQTLDVVLATHKEGGDKIKTCCDLQREELNNIIRNTVKEELMSLKTNGQVSAGERTQLAMATNTPDAAELCAVLDRYKNESSDKQARLEKKCSEYEIEIAKLKEELATLKATNSDDKNQIENNKSANEEQVDSKKHNIIVHGVPENDSENMQTTVTDILKKAECSYGWKVVTKAYRLGKKSIKKTTESACNADTDAQNSIKKPESRPRGIKIHLQNENQRKELFKSKRTLTSEKKYKDITMRPDRTEDEMLEERTVQQMYVLAKTIQDVKEVRMRGRSIEINGTYYKPEDFDQIKVKDISPEQAATRYHKWGTSFQGHNAPYSNFYKCNIKGKDGKNYLSAEQYYCSIMAKFHNEMDIMRQIDNTSNPYTIKAIAKKIWRSPEWCKDNERVLEDIVRAKFTQNKDLKEKLMSTSTSVFRECTRCPYWGSGRFLKDAEAGENEIPGYKNKMGIILQKVKESFVTTSNK